MKLICGLYTKFPVSTTKTVALCTDGKTKGLTKGRADRKIKTEGSIFLMSPANDK